MPVPPSAPRRAAARRGIVRLVTPLASWPPDTAQAHEVCSTIEHALMKAVMAGGARAAERAIAELNRRGQPFALAETIATAAYGARRSTAASGSLTSAMAPGVTDRELSAHDGGFYEVPGDLAVTTMRRLQRRGHLFADHRV